MKMGSLEKQSFTTEMTWEVKDLTWKVKNFTGIIAVNDELKGIELTFDAGDTIGLPTQWKFHFVKTGDKLGIHLKLHKNLNKGKYDSMFANFDCVIADEGYKFGEKMPVAMDVTKSKPKIDPLLMLSQTRKIPHLENGHLILRIKFVLYNFTFKETTGHKKRKLEIVDVSPPVFQDKRQVS